MGIVEARISVVDGRGAVDATGKVDGGAIVDGRRKVDGGASV
jgi:hypothetical protein